MAAKRKENKEKLEGADRECGFREYEWKNSFQVAGKHTPILFCQTPLQVYCSLLGTTPSNTKYTDNMKRFREGLAKGEVQKF